MAAGTRVDGPAIVESSFTTVVIDPGASVVRSANGNLIVEMNGQT
jgi:N-methylhydantoinase A